MAKAFYLKLATGNLRRNRRMYGPYCAASALMSGMCFIILNLVFSRSVRNLDYGGTVQIMFTIGIVVMCLFTTGYMLYINSFLIKRRKKEFGLYGVLGMERRHVARLILWENAILSFGSLLLGLAFGLLFGRLAFLILMRLLDTAQGSVFTLSLPAALLTSLVFCAIFVLTTLYNLNQWRLASPVDLIRGERKGEKKVRAPLLTTLLGTGLLSWAYYLAVTSKNSVSALMGFWPAVVLVIAATWLLFTGGSVFVLRRLQKNRRIYYRPRNFITISGLTHRMKQNAAGLANICILSTMVMVTVACCLSLYLGEEDILAELTPNDIALSIQLPDAAMQEEVLDLAEASAQGLAAQHGVTPEWSLRYRSTQYLVPRGGPALSLDDARVVSFGAALDESTLVSLVIVPLDDYNAATGARQRLAPDEVLVLATEDPGLEMVTAAGETYYVAGVRSDTRFTAAKHLPMSTRLYVVAPDEEAGLRLTRALNPDALSGYTSSLYLNVGAAQADGLAYATALRAGFRADAASAMEALGSEDGFYRTNDIFTNRNENYGFFGGLLFLGVFFALLFLINTVLILYFKQISEGFDDRERFEILQKVGLSDDEVRATINRQMLIVFLLPLAFALVHIAAASNMIQMMLGSFNLTNFRLTLLCILGAAAVFAAVYLLVYRLTARTYYRLVKW